MGAVPVVRSSRRLPCLVPLPSSRLRLGYPIQGRRCLRLVRSSRYPILRFLPRRLRRLPTRRHLQLSRSRSRFLW